MPKRIENTTELPVDAARRGLKPERIGTMQHLAENHFLAQGIRNATNAFSLGNTDIRLELEATSILGSVHEYSRMQASTGARNLVLETGLAAVKPNSASARAIQQALNAYQLPGLLQDSQHFAALTVRHRDEIEAARRAGVGLEQEIRTTRAVTAIVALSGSFHDSRIAAHLLLPTRRSKVLGRRVRPSAITVFLPAVPDAPPKSPEVTAPPEATPEEFSFTDCFLGCAKETTVWFGTLATGLTPVCVAAIAALPATAGASAILSIPACIATIAVLIAPVALCAGSCGVDALFD